MIPHQGPQRCSTPTKDMDFCVAEPSLHIHTNRLLCCSWKDVAIISLRGGATFANRVGLWVQESWILFVRLLVFLQIILFAFVYLFLNSVLPRDLLATLLQGVSPSVSSLTPWLSDFRTVQFSVSPGYFLFLNLLLSFFWLWEEAQCVYLRLPLGQKPYWEKCLSLFKVLVTIWVGGFIYIR